MDKAMKKASTKDPLVRAGVAMNSDVLWKLQLIKGL
jgi:hypothetical protein